MIKRHYNFERFNGFNPRAENTISITRGWTFGISQGFSAEFEIYKFRYAVLYFDKINKSLAFRFTNDENEPVKFVVSKRDNGAAEISAKSFLQKYDLDAGTYAGKYLPERFHSQDLGINEQGYSYVINLNEKK